MKTASRILMTFAMLAFFSGITFSQVASTTNLAKATVKTATTTTSTVKSTDDTKTGSCANHMAKGACAQGKNFVDKNGDGICDNCGSTGKCKENCSGKGQGCASGCSQTKGKGNCCAQGQKQGNNCTKPCGNAPAAQPKK